MARRTWCGAAVVGWLLLAAGCGGEEPSAGGPPGCESTSFAEPGPFAAGVTLLDVDGVAVEVWYPADPASTAGREPDAYDLREWLPADDRARIPADAPTTFTTDAYRDVPASGDGPFPVVLFSHGLGGYRLQSTFLTAHLATWGFIVAAPEHAERNLTAVLGGADLRDESVSQMTGALSALRDAPGPLLLGAADTSRVALAGHSAGGGAIQALVDGGHVDASAWLSMATFAASAEPLPALVLGGSRDQIATPENVERGYDGITHSDKRYVSIEGAGHLAFTDICVIGRERGGVLQIARDAGVEVSDLVLQLATDGCRPEDLPAEEAWPVIRHYATAHLRHTLAGEEATAALAEESTECFDGLVARWRAGAEE